LAPVESIYPSSSEYSREYAVASSSYAEAAVQQETGIGQYVDILA
jgi:hypothetical protein